MTAPGAPASSTTVSTAPPIPTPAPGPVPSAAVQATYVQSTSKNGGYYAQSFGNYKASKMSKLLPLFSKFQQAKSKKGPAYVSTVVAAPAPQQAVAAKAVYAHPMKFPKFGRKL